MKRIITIIMSLFWAGCGGSFVDQRSDVDNDQVANGFGLTGIKGVILEETESINALGGTFYSYRFQVTEGMQSNVLTLNVCQSNCQAEIDDVSLLQPGTTVSIGSAQYWSKQNRLIKLTDLMIESQAIQDDGMDEAIAQATYAGIIRQDLADFTVDGRTYKSFRFEVLKGLSQTEVTLNVCKENCPEEVDDLATLKPGVTVAIGKAQYWFKQQRLIKLEDVTVGSAESNPEPTPEPIPDPEPQPAPDPNAPKYEIFVMQALYLGQAAEINNASVLSQADGIVIRTRWQHVEPQDDQFDFSWLQTQFAKAERYGLKIEFQILAGNDTPAWLKNRGATGYDGDGWVVDPWSDVYQAEYAELLREAVKVLPMNRVVEYAAPGADNAEWHYQVNHGAGYYSRASYSNNKMIEGKKAIARIIANTFPSHVKVGLHLGDFGKSGNWVRTAAEEIVNDHPEGRVSIQTNALNGKGVEWDGVNWIGEFHSQGIPTGFEEVTTNSTSRYGGPISVAQAMAAQKLPNGGQISVYMGNDGVRKWKEWAAQFDR